MDIDKEITEKVMGYTHFVGKEVPGYAIHRDEPIGNQEVWAKDESSFFCKHCGNMPAYSTDIANAFEVVEKMYKDGWLIDLYHQHRQKDGSYIWQADFTKAKGVDNGYEGVVADTVPMAICLAALKAIK